MLRNLPPQRICRAAKKICKNSRFRRSLRAADEALADMLGGGQISADLFSLSFSLDHFSRSFSGEFTYEKRRGRESNPRLETLPRNSEISITRWDAAQNLDEESKRTTDPESQKCPTSVQAQLSAISETAVLLGSRQSNSNRRPADCQSVAFQEGRYLGHDIWPLCNECPWGSALDGIKLWLRHNSGKGQPLRPARDE